MILLVEELGVSCWCLACVYNRCFSIRVNLPGIKNLLFGCSAAFPFGKAGEVLTVSFPPKLLPPFLGQSGPSTRGSAPGVCSCWGGMCVCVFSVCSRNVAHPQWSSVVSLNDCPTLTPTGNCVTATWEDRTSLLPTFSLPFVC